MREGGPVGLTASAEGTRVGVHVKPRASRSAIVGVREGQLDCAVAAPPVDGEANAELCALLARALGVKRRDVEVVAGSTGRTKVVEIRGLSPDALEPRIEAALTARDARGRK